MKKTLIAIALASTGFLALPALAQAQNNSGFFINGNIGQSSLDKGVYDDNDTGWAANFGYRWAVAPSALICIEGGYADLGKFGTRNMYTGLPFGNASIKGWNLGVNGHFNLTDNWYLSGRGGYFRPDVRGSYISSVTTDAAGNPVYGITTVDSSANKWYVGAGFGYDFSNNFSIGLNYDYYKANTSGLNFNPSLVSVSGEYRF